MNQSARLYGPKQGSPEDNFYINVLEAPVFSYPSSTSLLDECWTLKNSRNEWFSDLRYCWRTPLTHSYPSVQSQVMESERIQKIIENSLDSTSNYNHSLKRQVKVFFYKMRASFSKFLCKIASYVLFKIFRRISTRVLVCPSQMKRLKKAEEMNVPILYLPLHRSHLDYFLITWTVWQWNIRLPHIASGNNLNMSGLGWLLRGFGAFFIRRKCNGNNENTSDQLYRAVLNTYMIELLKKGLSIEFFLEGTRSRFGKTLIPKNGLISNIVSAVLDGEISDVLLVPVSITYDSTIEGILINELQGCSKKQESILTVVRGFLTCFWTSGRCGDIVLDYGTPVLLTEHLKKLSQSIEKHNGLLNLNHDINPNSYRELVPWKDTENKMLIRSVGYDLVYQAQQQKPINTASLIAMLFVCRYRQDSIPLKRILFALNELAREIQDLGFTLTTWNVDDYDHMQSLFDHGSKFIKDSIVVVKKDLERQKLENSEDEFFVQMRCYAIECLLKLAYYKNNAIPPFILISMSAIALLSLSENKPTLEECSQRVIDLCNMLQFEIIFCSPCDDLGHEIYKAFVFLNYKEPTNIHDFIKNVEASSVFCVSLNEERKTSGARFGIHFYANILRPFLQTCFVVVTDLIARPQIYHGVRDEDYIQNLISTYPKNSNVSFDLMPEAINQNSICNAITLLRFKGIVSNESLCIIDLNKATNCAESFKLYLGEGAKNIAFVAAAS